MANAQAAQSKRLYVEPFTTKEGSEKLRDDVTVELRKLTSVSLAANESAADLILGGGGEIWVRGYRSLNPRAGERPSNGTPVYGGFLAVELRDRKGETLWSYLVTPGAASGDMSRNLSKQIAKHVADALQQPGGLPQAVAPALPTPGSPSGTTLKGAGATFHFPLYTKWFTNYRRVNPNLEFSYDPIGSEAGIRRLLAGETDFGASDSPDAITELSPGQEGKYRLFPSAVGAVVPIVNLPGFTGEIAFTPEVLAGIYLGKIKKWNDPAIQRANPHLHLPNLDIVVIHRSDGSGTSYVWTDFLSKASPDWKAQVGSGLDSKWPVGRPANGNEGVAGLVKEIGGSIGYVEFIYALQQHLSYGKVRNRAGEFIAASLESIGIAASRAPEIGDDLKVSILNAPGPGAYPISSFTWLVVPAHIPDEAKRTALASFLKWMLGPGQTQAATLGYVGLPKDLIAKEEAAVLKMN
jgi:phosphate transport system substrate-binding protein